MPDSQFRVLIVGCGQLGSRHLQAVASLTSAYCIEVVDPRPEALQLGRDRLHELGVDRLPEVRWLQSLDDATLRWMNRGHDAATFLNSVERAVAKGLRVCTHVILGFPQETDDSVAQLGRALGALGIDGIKIHNLHVIANTPLAKIYRDGGLAMLSRDAYVRRVRLLLENLPPEIWVHRVTGEAPADEMLAPDWAFDKSALLAAVDRELEENDSVQGKALRPAFAPANP